MRLEKNLDELYAQDNQIFFEFDEVSYHLRVILYDQKLFITIFHHRSS